MQGLPGHRHRWKVALSRQAAVERTANAFSRAVDGDIKIGLRILDDQGGRALEAYLDPATLIYAAARTIDIGQAHNDARDNVTTMIQGIIETRRHMLAQPIGQGEILSLDLKVHDIPLVEVEDDRRIIDAPNIRYKQI
jgi:hypothetical protein